MIKVRATQDGHYGGYYRTGPIETDSGTKPGEVFELDETPQELRDEHGKPVLELDSNGKPIPVIVNGKPKLDPATGKPMFKVKTASFFSPEWMERVPDDTEVTNDYQPIEQVRRQGPLSVYQVKKPKKMASSVAVAVPAIPMESPI